MACAAPTNLTQVCSFSSPVAVRLTNDANPSEEPDIVEVFINGEWGELKSYSWDPLDGAVVCRQLGYKGVNRTYSKFTGVIPQHSSLSWLSCNGQEVNLLQCPQSALELSTSLCHNSDHTAGVVCTNEDLPNEGEYVDMQASECVHDSFWKNNVIISSYFENMHC